ncbi:MAG: ABC transporter permease [Acidimicrobiia bacterium]
MKLLAIAASGLRRMFRDRTNYFFVFILPLGIIVIIGSLFGSGFRPTIGVVAPDAGVGAALAERIADIDEVDIVSYEDRADLVVAVERSTVQAGVSIDENFDDALEAGDTGPVEYLARPDSAGPQLQALVSAVVTEFSYDVTAARLTGDDLGTGIAAAVERRNEIGPVEVRRSSTGEATFDPSLGQFDLGASSQLVLFMFLTGLTGSAALIQSRQLGVSRRMLGTPTSARTIIVGETLARFAVVLVQGLYILFVTLIVFGVDWGDPLGAAAIMTLFGLVGAGAAMLMGSVFQNDQQAGGVGVMLGLGLAALGGAMVPIEVMPAGMQNVARFTPHAWAIDAFGELVREDGTIIDIGPQLGVLALFAGVLLVLAAWRFRTVLTRGD